MLYKTKNSNWSLGKYAAVALLVAACGSDSDGGTTTTQAPATQGSTTTGGAAADVSDTINVAAGFDLVLQDDPYGLYYRINDATVVK